MMILMLGIWDLISRGVKWLADREDAKTRAQHERQRQAYHELHRQIVDQLVSAPPPDPDLGESPMRVHHDQAEIVRAQHPVAPEPMAGRDFDVDGSEWQQHPLADFEKPLREFFEEERTLTDAWHDTQLTETERLTQTARRFEFDRQKPSLHPRRGLPPLPPPPSADPATGERLIRMFEEVERKRRELPPPPEPQVDERPKYDPENPPVVRIQPKPQLKKRDDQ